MRKVYSGSPQESSKLLNAVKFGNKKRELELQRNKNERNKKNNKQENTQNSQAMRAGASI